MPIEASLAYLLALVGLSVSFPMRRAYKYLALLTAQVVFEPDTTKAVFQLTMPLAHNSTGLVLGPMYSLDILPLEYQSIYVMVKLQDRLALILFSQWCPV